ncbi:MAG: polysaccharide deacetylase family protein [Paludibacter sp.]|nr:polysaccharide deacetylase family protein [Paludibacter sp.]MBP6611177.1 polysaccharide deacetylase family protein [Paludibacter sp.]MBP6635152.1 polysaccharide deacetylase family protein [Paludibacter sp.]MBP7613264.1 polysaccharide deacetylase family protein [Paludibacter sp.]
MLLIIFMFFCSIATAQSNDIHAIYTNVEGTQSSVLFKNTGSNFSVDDYCFLIQKDENGQLHSNLTVSGDFNGDCVQETALFYDYAYVPNGKPKFYGSKIIIYGQQDQYISPVGVWFSSLKTDFDFSSISFASAGDFNSDGRSDIALFWSKPNVESHKIIVLISNGSGFEDPKEYYLTEKNEFNFERIKFAVSGDFVGDEKTDLAVFYDYYGNAAETNQRIFIFECKTDSFGSPKTVFTATKASYNFNLCKTAISGDFNGDGMDDIACIINDESKNKQAIDVFVNQDKTSFPKINFLTPDKDDFNFAHVKIVAGGYVTNDHKSDIVMCYNYAALGTQVIFVFESTGTGFLPYKNYFSTEKSKFSFDNVNALLIGKYAHSKKVSPTMWYENKKGAVTFGFDDGMTNALRYGASELSNNMLKGTFYIISDVPFKNERDYCNWDTLRYYKNMGHEMGSHNGKHIFSGNYINPDSLHILENILSKSKYDLDTQLNQNTLSLSYPFGSFNQQTPKVVNKYFQNARTSQTGYNISTPFDFQALKSFYVASTTSNETVKSWLSTAEYYNYHLSLMYHNIQNQPYDKLADEYSYALNDFKQHISDAKQANLWIETQGSVYKYITQRNALQLMSYESFSDSVRFTVDDFLDDNLFDQKITLKVALPEDWLVDSVHCNMSNTKLPVVHQYGQKFCYLNAIPDHSNISIYKSETTDLAKSTTRNNQFNCYRLNNQSVVIEPLTNGNTTYSIKIFSITGTLLHKELVNLASTQIIQLAKTQQPVFIVLYNNCSQMIEKKILF